MSDENLQVFPDSNDFIATANYYAEIYEAYSWHFRIRERPATFDELVRFATWEGLQNKRPTKRELVDFFLDKKICF